MGIPRRIPLQEHLNNCIILPHLWSKRANALPKSTWVIFEVLGALRPSSGKMVEICKRIYSEWFVNSDYMHAPIPEIEFYHGDGDFWSEDLKSEIWIPIEKKE